MPVRALLFDKDGTLVDIQSTLGPATCDVLAHLSGGDAALFGRLADVTRVDARARRLLPGCPVISEATDVYGRTWAGVLGRPFTQDFCAEIDRLYLRACLDHLHPVGDPLAVFAGLKARGFALGIMTNDAAANARAQLRRDRRSRDVFGRLRFRLRPEAGRRAGPGIRFRSRRRPAGGRGHRRQPARPDRGARRRCGGGRCPLRAERTGGARRSCGRPFAVDHET
jgi:hypothetical protein